MLSSCMREFFRIATVWPMQPEGRARAGRAVEQRIARLGKTIPETAREAGIDVRTLRAFIRGKRWPTVAVRMRLCEVLDWAPGEIVRLTYPSPLSQYPARDLLDEIARRLTATEQGRKDQPKRP